MKRVFLCALTAAFCFGLKFLEFWLAGGEFSRGFDLGFAFRGAITYAVIGGSLSLWVTKPPKEPTIEVPFK